MKNDGTKNAGRIATAMIVGMLSAAPAQAVELCEGLAYGVKSESAQSSLWHTGTAEGYCIVRGFAGALMTTIDACFFSAGDGPFDSDLSFGHTTVPGNVAVVPIATSHVLVPYDSMAPSHLCVAGSVRYGREVEECPLTCFPLDDAR